MPFTASDLDEVQRRIDGPAGRCYDVELPYRRLGRCRMSDAVAAAVGTGRAEVALALSAYEARNGKHRTASELLGPGVDLGAEDTPVVASGSPHDGVRGASPQPRRGRSALHDEERGTDG
jgi:hypothetical protein